MSSVIIPIPQNILKREENDHPTPVFKINYVGYFPYGRNFTNRSNITVIYPNSIEMKPFEHKTIYFPVLVETSLPMYSIITGSDLLFRFGLSSSITIVPSDSFLFTSIFNYTEKTITLPKNSLTFTCSTVIATVKEYNEIKF